MREFVVENRCKDNAFIINHLQAAVVLLSVDGTILFIDKQVFDMLNIVSDPQVVGSHFTTFLHLDSINNALTDINDLVENKKIESVVYRFNSIDGIAIWLKIVPQLIEIMGTPMILFSLYDVLSQKGIEINRKSKNKYDFDHYDEQKLEEIKLANDNLIIELSLAKEKAEESVKLKNALLKNMSHEFRTPLNGIIGFSSLLAEDIDDEDMKRMAQIIFESGTRLCNTLDAVLIMSQLESGVMNVNYEFIDFYQTVQSLLFEYQKSANKKGITFSFQCLNKFSGSSDLRLFSLIVNNLVDNALKFTNEGAVVISLNIAVINNRNCLVLEVSDTGIGIPLESQKTVFKEFVQIKSDNIQCIEGVGLGLSIVSKSLVLLGGNITLVSTVNVGSIFTAYIPLNNYCFSND